MKQPISHDLITCRRCKIRSECLYCNPYEFHEKFYNLTLCLPCYFKSLFPDLLTYPDRSSRYDYMYYLTAAENTV